MVCAGNHEIELNSEGSHFLAYESRFRMPGDKPAEFGDNTPIPASIDPNTGDPYCCSSVYQTEYNYGSSFYSFDASSAHVVFLNPYSTSNQTSVQYQWLQSDLQAVNRSITPWVVVVMHCPWYSSNMVRPHTPLLNQQTAVSSISRCICRNTTKYCQCIYHRFRVDFLWLSYTALNYTTPSPPSSPTSFLFPCSAVLFFSDWSGPLRRRADGADARGDGAPVLRAQGEHRLRRSRARLRAQLPRLRQRNARRCHHLRHHRYAELMR